ncbi:MAG: DEAD/DEAH box helicase family protein [Psychrilyobacter sp.]|uniref:DEAD/DEAH box helicase family protein n=1 Tax=Psychrilyobacter sp. TaxID=2586924 RepID=UPI003C786D2C
MENATKKSLFNKELESITYNPNLIVNTNIKNIKDKVQNLLRTSKRVDIAVSYAVWSGLSLIYQDLKKFNSDSRIIVTTEGMVTDPRSLKKLLELPMESKVYTPRLGDKGFHLKTYLGEGEDQYKIILGSSNISARAFGLVHELAVEINSKKDGYIIEEHTDIFNNIWEDPLSKTITTELIKQYTQLFNEKKELNKKIHDIQLKNNIIPNYMQEKALIELKNCREESAKGLVIAATGTGKTYLSAFDVKQFEAKKVLFLVHNRLILTSAIETFQKVFTNKKLLELNSSNLINLHNYDMVFTTDKTAYSHLYNKISNDYFDYIIYDEAHKIGENTRYHNLINFFTPKFTLGITATPERTEDPKFLFDIFNYTVPYEIRLLDAMNHQLVCPFTYYGLDLEERLLEPNEKFNYYELAKFMREQLNEKGHFGEKLKGIVFCSQMTEASKLSIELNDIGINAKSITSDNSNRQDVENYIKQLKSDTGAIELLCVVNKFNEGVDIPEINTIFMVRSTTSSIIYLQQLGRGLRKTEDPHKYVTVFDIIGNSNNNYSIAEVLTGNTTADKRTLFEHANEEFKTISPFINVKIEEKAMENIIKSISNNFKVESRLKTKIKDELYRFKEIPTLVELYNNPNFKELDLLQLLCKNFYEPFMDKYVEKYNITKDDRFLMKFFGLITQFTFRSYSSEILKEYIKLLRGEKISNQELISILVAKDVNGKKTAINSDYFKKGNDFVNIFNYETRLSLTTEVIEELKSKNAYELLIEHIELFEELSKKESYKMKTFDLVDKGEFLYNMNSNDYYINGTGEREDPQQKKFYSPIQITNSDSFHNNYIDDRGRVVYMTKESTTMEGALKKVEMLENGYKMVVCAKFPHLGYSSTAYFNLGETIIEEISPVKIQEKKNGSGKTVKKYNNKIFLRLDKKIPEEFLQYKK